MTSQARSADMNNEDAMELTEISLLGMMAYSLVAKRHEDCILERLKIGDDGVGDHRKEILAHLNRMVQMRESALDALMDLFSILDDDVVAELQLDAKEEADVLYSGWAVGKGAPVASLSSPNLGMNNESSPTNSMQSLPKRRLFGSWSREDNMDTDRMAIENGAGEIYQPSSGSTPTPSTSSKRLAEEKEAAAARIAKEEIQRVGAEQSDAFEASRAEEQRARNKADRIAHDAELKRLSEENEAARIAHEAKQKRLSEGNEAARIAHEAKLKEGNEAARQRVEADRLADKQRAHEVALKQRAEVDRIAAEEHRAREEEAISNRLKKEQGVARLAAETKNDEQYDKLIQRYDERTDQSLYVTVTTLLKKVQDIIDAIFDTQQSKLDIIPSLTTALVCLFSPLTKFNRVYAEHIQTIAGERARVINFDVTRSIASLLLDCDADKDVTETDEVRPAVPDMILKLKKAISCDKNNDDTAQADFEAEISNDTLGNFIQVGHPTKKLTSHVLHLGIIYAIISTLTVFLVHADLGKCSEYVARAKDLARRVNPQARFDEDTTMLDYLKIFAFPGLENDASCELAITVVCEMFASLTDTKSPKRRPRLLKCYKTAETKTLAGGTDEDAVYCSGEGKDCYRRRRHRIVRTCLVMILKRPIQQRLPDGLFSGRGFTRTLLRLSPKHIATEFSFVKGSFFQTDRGEDRRIVKYGEDNKIVKRIRSKIVEKTLKSTDDDTGKRTIIIESQEQIDSLKRLLVANI